MLPNLPPEGTSVRFVRDVQKAKAFDTATLVRALEKFPIDQPGDRFEVIFRGERMIVQRQDIERS